MPDRSDVDRFPQLRTNPNLPCMLSISLCASISEAGKYSSAWPPLAKRTGVLAFALALSACGQAPSTDQSITSNYTHDVRPGIDILLSDSSHLIDGRRVGLITNRSGVGRDGTSSIDILYTYPRTNLVALFAPEHGIRGSQPEGIEIPDTVDPSTGIPIYSLYGKTRAPTEKMLEGIDVLVFDLQDIGARYYTYQSTMALAMQAAGREKMPFVVLDRPNPLGGAVNGPTLNPAFASFVGPYPIPVRHGMTIGELAHLFTGEFNIEVDLHVVPTMGWTRNLWFDDTGLVWVPPSLNMPSLESATHYPGTCLFEGTNFSVGRGTTEAFQLLGSPWLDGALWAERLADYNLLGVRIEISEFTPQDPSDGKFDGVTMTGIRLVVTNRTSYDPVLTAVAALIEARRLSGKAWVWNKRHFDRLAGYDGLRLAIDRGDELENIVEAWINERSEFKGLRRPYLMY